MKFVKLIIKVAVALLTSIVIAASTPAAAEETGFALEYSIKNQIFLELKANVQDLFQNNSLFAPANDTSLAARVVSNETNNAFVRPVNIDASIVAKDKYPGTID